MSNHDKKAVLSFEGQEVEFDTTQILFIGDALIAYNEQSRDKNPMYFHKLFSPIMEIGSAMQEYKPPVVEPEMFPYPIYPAWSNDNKRFFMEGNTYNRHVIIGGETYTARPFLPDTRIDLDKVLFPVGPMLQISQCRLTGIVLDTPMGEYHYDVSNLPYTEFVKSPIESDGQWNLNFNVKGCPQISGRMHPQKLFLNALGHTEGDQKVIGLEFAFTYQTNHNILEHMQVIPAN